MAVPVIEAYLIVKEGAPPLKGVISRLSSLGCIFQMSGTTGLVPGSTAQIQFLPPGIGILWTESVRVMKSYYKMGDGSVASSESSYNTKTQIIEFHFTAMDPSRKSYLDRNIKMGSTGSGPA